MPALLCIRGYRFFFFSLEGREAPHVHVEQAERYAKIWLRPIALARSKGFRNSEIADIMELVREHRLNFEERWNEHFIRSL
jgi:hypothetical protein